MSKLARDDVDQTLPEFHTTGGGCGCRSGGPDGDGGGDCGGHCYQLASFIFFLDMPFL